MDSGKILIINLSKGLIGEDDDGINAEGMMLIYPMIIDYVIFRII